jgi:hypothetical protein
LQDVPVDEKASSMDGGTLVVIKAKRGKLIRKKSGKALTLR